MNKIKAYIAKMCLIFLFIIVSYIIFMSHYVAFGECAARLYYKPLDVTDYILLLIVGIVLLSISLRYIRTNKAVRYIEVSIYSIIMMFILVFGNEILASRTIDWPETYKVQPLESVNTGKFQK